MPHKDPAASAAYKKRWREENEEAIAKQRKRYRDENKEALAEQQKRHRAEKTATRIATNDLTAHVDHLYHKNNRSYYIDKAIFMQLWQSHLETHGPYCAVTGEKFDMTSEGTRPSPDQISPGSGYWAWNIRFTTVSYNLARSNYGDDRFESMCRSYIASLV